jgi:hypothetical protein
MAEEKKEKLFEDAIREVKNEVEKLQKIIKKLLDKVKFR